MHRTQLNSLLCILSLLLGSSLAAACGPGATGSSTAGAGGGGTTATRDSAPAKCPQLEIPAGMLQQKTLTRRVRKLACGLQACFDAASAKVKKRKGYIKLSVTIDRGGRIEAIRLTSRRLPESVTSCVRSKALRWDFDIRDDSFTYGPIKLRVTP